MFNALRKIGRMDGGSIGNAISMIAGHFRFLQNNTGETYDPEVQHFVQNNQGVLSNNRHFIAWSQMEYQPNGDGTTEGQALHILGHAYAYLATKDKRYLDAAEFHFDAYIKYFYAGQPIPDTPQRYICNWIVNSKQPVLANWPIDPVEPTHSGFKGVEFEFTNGFLAIPHNAPHWGQYLDKATFAFDGHLAWDAINASVQASKADGTVDWDKPGIQYDVDWIIDSRGDKIDWDGNVISRGHPPEQYGHVQLKDTTVNGIHKFNYATRQPVEHGGYLIGRNEVQHNRPLHVPLLGSVNQMGNAADAEEWFIDASYVLWRITGKEMYKKAMDAAMFTAHEYTLIDSTDKFFRQSTAAATPYTDGISYSFTYPDTTTVVYDRDADGYITISTDTAAQESMEQQSVWFRINRNSKVRTCYGGLDINGGALTAKLELLINNIKSDTGGVKWGAALPKSTSMSVVTYDLPMSNLVRLVKEDGTDYIMADARSVTEYGTCTWSEDYETNILEGRQSNVINATFADDSGGLIIGFWLLEAEVAPINSITYRSDAMFDLRVTDDDGWRWYWILPSTNNAWVTQSLDKSTMLLASYQPDANGRPTPSAPNFTLVDQVTVILENSTDVNKRFSYYCVNDVPPTFQFDDGYTLKYRLTIQGQAAFNARVGDCVMLDYRLDSLAYCPGVIPFSNIYAEGTEQIGAWHGMPYPGYQYPVIYCIDPDEKFDWHLNNMVDFLYDSQQWYYQKFGVLGPGASAYIWNRWDNYKYGPPDTWTMYHWGDGIAWSGYQPRAFMGACRAWYELVIRGKEVPSKLIQYAENWITWLVDFVKKSNGITPTDFPPESLPEPNPDDFTGHMCGLWLSGACFAALAGSKVPELDYLIETCVAELQHNYNITDIPNHAMNGSWSPALRLGTDNGMFFGFWAGEILRGLGMYVLYKKYPPGTDIHGV